MQYRTVAFIDANVALQCLDLKQLPWSEVDRQGPILVLATPTVLKQVEARKTDGRLGDHARRFNNHLRPLLQGQDAVPIRAAAPQVDLALGQPAVIQWPACPDLDPGDSDACIVAEALHTAVPDGARKLFISQDIWPLNLARRKGLDIHHLGESWLRPKELSEAERKAAALARQLEELKSSQPIIGLKFSAKEPVSAVIRIDDLTAPEREALVDRIRLANPITEQRLDGVDRFLAGGYDASLSGRYKKWSDKTLPKHIAEIERRLEAVINQVELRLVITNEGRCQADSLLVEVSAEGGWLNDLPIVAYGVGPAAPQPRPYSPVPSNHFPQASIQVARTHGRHEVVIERPPKRARGFRITCDDFRQGAQHEIRFVACLDPRVEGPLVLRAVATARNLSGETEGTATLTKRIESASLEALVDLSRLHWKWIPLFLRRWIDRCRTKRSGFDFEWFGEDP